MLYSFSQVNKVEESKQQQLQAIRLHLSPMNSHVQKLIVGLKSLANGQSDYIYEFPTFTKPYQCNISELFADQIHHRFPNITDQFIAQDFSDYLSLPGELLGRKSPEVVISSSQRLCLKMIDIETVQKIKEILAELLQFKDENEENYLVEIYRIYKVESMKEKYSRTDLYLLMPSLRVDFQHVISIYDIKGYVDNGRSLSHEDFKTFKFGKDQNFVSSDEITLLRSLPLQTRKGILQKMKRTIMFLESKHIIDYSLLICFRNSQGVENKAGGEEKKGYIQVDGDKTIEWSIIDYFQEFNLKKKMEWKVKTLFKKEVSSAEPEIYSKRLMDFLTKYVIAQ